MYTFPAQSTSSAPLHWAGTPALACDLWHAPRHHPPGSPTDHLTTAPSRMQQLHYAVSCWQNNVTHSTDTATEMPTYVAVCVLAAMLVIAATPPAACASHSRLFYHGFIKTAAGIANLQDPVHPTSSAAHGSASAAPEAQQRPPPAPDGELAAAVAFLLRYQPASDRGTVTLDQLQREASLALEARYSQPWAAAVPRELFNNYVLPYANLDEPRDAWRPLFRRCAVTIGTECNALALVALVTIALSSRDASVRGSICCITA